MEIKIAHFYPELLNLYGDKGNIAALEKRCKWRGIKAETVEINSTEGIDLSSVDIVLMGGGTDKDQEIVLSELMKIKDRLQAYVENNGVMLALCGSFPMICRKFVLNGREYEGLSLIEEECHREEKRSISNIILETTSGKIAGFENHSERIELKNSTPFGKVLYGYGNNGKDGTEGVVYKNLTASFLHGPLLPKNPQLADDIISKAIIKKYGECPPLEKINDEIEYKAQNYIFDRFLKD